VLAGSRRLAHRQRRGRERRLPRRRVDDRHPWSHVSDGRCRVSCSTTVVHRAMYPDVAGRPGRSCGALGCRNPPELALVWGSGEAGGVWMGSYGKEVDHRRRERNGR
jgi:hypothetical protein